MKFVCINTQSKIFSKGESISYIGSLIIGEIYNISKIDKYDLFRIDELSIVLSKSMIYTMFKPLSEIREEKINKILE
jgi:hypothetical protein